MEENRLLKIVDKSTEISTEEINKFFPRNTIENDNSIDIELLANKVASKLNTRALNDELKKNSEKIDSLNQGIANLINVINKQTVDENNTSFKIARTNEKANILINSLDSHISFVVSLIHIAQCYHLMTERDNTKPSTNRARQLLVDLNLVDDTNFVSKSLNGCKLITKKYHFSIFSEIKNRLMAPANYGITVEISEKWRRIAFIPDDEEIKIKIDEIFSMLN